MDPYAHEVGTFGGSARYVYEASPMPNRSTTPDHWPNKPPAARDNPGPHHLQLGRPNRHQPYPARQFKQGRVGGGPKRWQGSQQRQRAYGGGSGARHGLHTGPPAQGPPEEQLLGHSGRGVVHPPAWQQVQPPGPRQLQRTSGLPAAEGQAAVPAAPVDERNVVLEAAAAPLPRTISLLPQLKRPSHQQQQADDQGQQQAHQHPGNTYHHHHQHNRHQQPPDHRQQQPPQKRQRQRRPSDDCPLNQKRNHRHPLPHPQAQQQPQQQQAQRAGVEEAQPPQEAQQRQQQPLTVMPEGALTMWDLPARLQGRLWAGTPDGAAVAPPAAAVAVAAALPPIPRVATLVGEHPHRHVGAAAAATGSQGQQMAAVGGAEQHQWQLQEQPYSPTHTILPQLPPRLRGRVGPCGTAAQALVPPVATALGGAGDLATTEADRQPAAPAAPAAGGGGHQEGLGGGASQPGEGQPAARAQERQDRRQQGRDQGAGQQQEEGQQQQGLLGLTAQQRHDKELQRCQQAGPSREDTTRPPAKRAGKRSRWDAIPPSAILLAHAPAVARHGGTAVQERVEQPPHQQPGATLAQQDAQQRSPEQERLPQAPFPDRWQLADEEPAVPALLAKARAAAEAAEGQEATPAGHGLQTTQQLATDCFLEGGGWLPQRSRSPSRHSGGNDPCSPNPTKEPTTQQPTRVALPQSGSRKRRKSRWGGPSPTTLPDTTAPGYPDAVVESGFPAEHLIPVTEDWAHQLEADRGRGRSPPDRRQQHRSRDSSPFKQEQHRSRDSSPFKQEQHRSRDSSPFKCQPHRRGDGGPSARQEERHSRDSLPSRWQEDHHSRDSLPSRWQEDHHSRDSMPSRWQAHIGRSGGLFARQQQHRGRNSSPSGPDEDRGRNRSPPHWQQQQHPSSRHEQQYGRQSHQHINRGNWRRGYSYHPAIPAPKPRADPAVRNRSPNRGRLARWETPSPTRCTGCATPDAVVARYLDAEVAGFPASEVAGYPGRHAVPTPAYREEAEPQDKPRSASPRNEHSGGQALARDSSGSGAPSASGPSSSGEGRTGSGGSSCRACEWEGGSGRSADAGEGAGPAGPCSSDPSMPGHAGNRSVHSGPGCPDDGEPMGTPLLPPGFGPAVPAGLPEMPAAAGAAVEMDCGPVEGGMAAGPLLVKPQQEQPGLQQHAFECQHAVEGESLKEQEQQQQHVHKQEAEEEEGNREMEEPGDQPEEESAGIELDYGEDDYTYDYVYYQAAHQAGGEQGAPLQQEPAAEVEAEQAQRAEQQPVGETGDAVSPAAAGKQMTTGQPAEAAGSGGTGADGRQPGAGKGGGRGTGATSGGQPSGAAAPPTATGEQRHYHGAGVANPARKDPGGGAGNAAALHGSQLPAGELVPSAAAFPKAGFLAGTTPAGMSWHEMVQLAEGEHAAGNMPAGGPPAGLWEAAREDRGLPALPAWQQQGEQEEVESHEMLRQQQQPTPASQQQAQLMEQSAESAGEAQQAQQQQGRQAAGTKQMPPPQPRPKHVQQLVVQPARLARPAPSVCISVWRTCDTPPRQPRLPPKPSHHNTSGSTGEAPAPDAAATAALAAAAANPQVYVTPATAAAAAAVAAGQYHLPAEVASRFSPGCSLATALPSVAPAVPAGGTGGGEGAFWYWDSKLERVVKMTWYMG
ncbi:hypothetical protein N2152v2_006620 [Parachlorella kessleri]